MTKEHVLRPDARLVRLHAERGDPQARLSEALAALEEADWGLLLSGEAALARQLAALLGPGTLRVDGRLDVNRTPLAEAGLAVADLHGDLGGARAVWLLEPDRAAFERARRAGVKVIVDGTLAPGGGWPAQGADYVVYRNAVTLTGYAEAPLAALFGQGQAPDPAAPAPSDLAVALALRDVATLPLRLARFGRTVAHLTERLGTSVRQAGPTALLLAPDAAADTLAPLGGILAAARHVPDGLLLTPGLEDTDSVLALLRGENPREVAAEEAEPQRERFERERPERRPREDRFRPERRPDWNRDGAGRRDRFRPQTDRPQADRFQPDRPERAAERRDRPARSEFNRPETNRPEINRAAAPEPESISRFTFEAPDLPAAPEVAAEEQPWEPEIVFSDIQQPPVPLTHTISSGPDAAALSELPPLAEPEQAETGQTEEEQADDLPTSEAEAEEVATAEPEQQEAAAEPEPEAAPIPLTPDLPAAPAADADGPAADLTEEQAAIYARLREWRNAEAKRQEISRFIVASNAALAEIARRVPYTLDDLAAVRGMGPARLQKYGEKILEVVRG
ncbi:HRDC domain-containing protein [Deinococcus sp. VB142]|uniref:HRDC domain-containing protein n=1 Tax=Deinococcus sp. VB142 TaxID=3112952 RepID=A0AAU6Q057_9DEIO